MSTPTLPPYLASWEDLRKALFHKPFLDNPYASFPRLAAPHPASAGAVVANPRSPSPTGPDDWRNAAVSYVVELIHIKELAHAVANPRVKQELGNGAKRALDQFFDHVCAKPSRGTGPNSPSGPPPWAWLLAVELRDAANSRSGRPRRALLHAAAQLAEKASGSGHRPAPSFAC
jgi:hypothetical protein